MTSNNGMFQLYSGPKSRDEIPMKLNNTAKIYDRFGVNFLAFGGEPLANQVIEYQKADMSNYTAKSADVPLDINRVKGGPLLDNTFNKRGVFKFRYEDIANPEAAGVLNYNRDFGGKDPTAIGYRNGVDDRAGAEKQLADFVKRDRDFTKRFDHLMPKRYERMGYGPRKMDSKTYFNEIDPIEAYSNYGYTESMDWTKRSGRENSTVISMDDRYCPDGSLVVAGQCLETDMETPTRYCPEGYQYQDGECKPQPKNTFMLHKPDPAQPSKATFAEEADPADPQIKQQPVCPPGWSYGDGTCNVSKEFKRISDK